MSHGDTRRPDEQSRDLPRACSSRTQQFPLIEIQAGTHDYATPKPGTIAAPRIETVDHPSQVALDRGKVDRSRARSAVTKADRTASSIVLGVHAREVNLVMATKSGKPIDVVVELDGRPIPATDRGSSVHEDANGRTVVTVDGSDLYYILRSPALETHLLSVTASAPGLEAYAFTFG